MELITQDLIQSELAERGAIFTPTELHLPDDLTEQDWAHIGQRLVRADQVIQWWLGDWAAFGERKYGQLKEFAEINHIPYQTVRIAAYVSNSFSIEKNGVRQPFRRRNNVAWSFHAELAALKPSQQIAWLDKIEQLGLARSELRRQLRLAAGEKDGLVSDGPGIRLAVNACDELTAWLTSRPVEFWADDQRAAVWMARLDPIVRFRAWLESPNAEIGSAGQSGCGRPPISVSKAKGRRVV